MPVVHAYILEGRPPERIQELMARITEAVCTALDVTPERVRVIVSEVPRTHWAVGGAPLGRAQLTAGPATPSVPTREPTSC